MKIFGTKRDKVTEVGENLITRNFFLLFPHPTLTDVYVENHTKTKEYALEAKCLVPLMSIQETHVRVQRFS